MQVTACQLALDAEVPLPDVCGERSLPSDLVDTWGR